MQFTIYRIIDKKTDEVYFKNVNTACFYEFSFPSGKNIDNLKFTKGRYFDIFFLKKDLNKLVTDDIIQMWLKGLRRLGLNISYSEVDIKRSDKYPERIKEGLNCMWRLDMDRYTSKAQLKFAAHTIRYLYEGTMYQPLIEVKKELDKNKYQSTFELFQAKAAFVSTGSHSYIYAGNFRNLLSNKDIKEAFKLWETKANNNEISDLFCNLVLKQKQKTIYGEQIMAVTTIKSGLDKDTSLAQYKKYIKTLI